MLQSMREWSQGIVAWIVVTLVCISFALWGVHSYIEGSGASTIAATVNGIDISQRQFHSAYQRLLQQQQIKLGAAFALNAVVEKQLKEQALQQLIFNEILTQAATQQKFRFTPEQENTVLRATPAFQTQGQFSPARFQESITNIGFTIDEFLVDFREAMLINQLRAGLMASAFALPIEVNQSIKLIMQKRDIVYAQIPQERFLRSVDVPDRDIEAYYHQHEDQFKTLNRVSIQYIELSLPELKKHISQKAEQAYADLIEKAVNMTYSNPTSLNSAAEALGLRIKTTGLFSQQGGNDPLTRNPKIIAAAFSSDVLDQNNNSNVIELDDQHSIILRIKEHQPSTLRALSEVSGEIRTYLKKEKAQQEAIRIAREVATQLQKGISTKQLAEKFQLKWDQKNAVGRYDKTLNSMIINQAFHLPKPTKISSISSAAFALPSGDAVILNVVGAHEGEPQKMTEQEKRVYQVQIERANGQLDYERYVSGLFKKAKIVIK